VTCIAVGDRQTHHLRANADRTLCGRPTVPHGAADDCDTEESASFEAKAVAATPLCPRCTAASV
jgi:hypothetical protein